MASVQKDHVAANTSVFIPELAISNNWCAADKIFQKEQLIQGHLLAQLSAATDAVYHIQKIWLF